VCHRKLDAPYRLHAFFYQSRPKDGADPASGVPPARAGLLRPFQVLSRSRGTRLRRGLRTRPEGAGQVSTGQRPVCPPRPLRRQVFPVPDRRRVNWTPTVGRTAGSGDPRRTKQIRNDSSRGQRAVKTNFAACQHDPSTGLGSGCRVLFHRSRHQLGMEAVAIWDRVVARQPASPPQPRHPDREPGRLAPHRAACSIVTNRPVILDSQL